MSVRSDALWTGFAIFHVSLLLALCLPDSLTRRFNKATEAFTCVFGLGMAGTTFSGFAQARLRHGPQVLQIAQTRLRLHVQQVARDAGIWELYGWIVFYCDGSRGKAPRSKANLKHLGLNGRHGQMPQAWITTLRHVSGLTWGWIVDRGDASERNHLRLMLSWLPFKTLIVTDAGYTGFDLWMAILDAKHNFLCRVGANARLIHKLADACHMQAFIRPGTNILYLWPQDQQKSRCLPIVLRLIVSHNGKHPVYLVTSVLDSNLLSDQQAIRIYAGRWQVELWFRSLKQTMGAGKLCSQNPQQAQIEFSFAAMALAVLGLIQTKALLAKGISPHCGSCAGALQVLRAAIDRQMHGPAKPKGIMVKLAKAIKDSYQRTSSKESNNYPTAKMHCKTSPPQIRDATPSQHALYQQLIAINIPLAFTA